MERDAYKRLLAWKGAATRKPLLMRGARQTGKTWLLRAFGRERYAASHYFNFEQTPDIASLFQRDLNPERIVRDLSIFAGAQVLPERSLIILDEIQACNAALNSLKYFAEDAPSTTSLPPARCSGSPCRHPVRSRSERWTSSISIP